jgi:hypothetical protein
MPGIVATAIYGVVLQARPGSVKLSVEKADVPVVEITPEGSRAQFPPAAVHGKIP